MNECRMVEFCPCKVIGIIISAILGIVAGALFFSGIITVLPFVFWFFIIFAAIAIVLLVISVLAFCIGMCDEIIECFCRNLGFLLTGSIVTLILGIFLLVFALETPFIVSVLIGLLVLFFGILITGIVCFLLCVCERECPDNDNNAGVGNNCCCCCYPCNCDCNNSNTDNSTDNNHSCRLKC